MPPYCSAGVAKLANAADLESAVSHRGLVGSNPTAGSLSIASWVTSISDTESELTSFQSGGSGGK